MADNETESRNQTGKTAPERDSKGRWATGNPGRPKGSRNRIAQTVERLLGDDIEAVTNAVLKRALKGDMLAARIILDRLAPPRKDSPVKVDLPDLHNAQSVTEALAKIAQAMAEGELTPEEAQRTGAVVEAVRQSLDMAQLEARIENLEKVLKR